MTRLLIFAFILILALSACSTPGGARHSAPADSQFVNYYADRLILTEEDNILHSDSATRQSHVDSLNLVYHLSSAGVDAATTDLQKDPEIWKGFYDQVVRRIEQVQQMDAAVSHTHDHPR